METAASKGRGSGQTQCYVWTYQCSANTSLGVSVCLGFMNPNLNRPTLYKIQSYHCKPSVVVRQRFLQQVHHAPFAGKWGAHSLVKWISCLTYQCLHIIYHFHIFARKKIGFRRCGDYHRRIGNRHYFRRECPRPGCGAVQ